MVYCKKCGKEVDSTSKFCKNCGDKIVTPIQTMPIKKTNWKWILWIIVLIFLLLLVMNIISNKGSVGTSYSREDKWWGTTHEETKYSWRGKETTTKDCPFWNRDC